MIKVNTIPALRELTQSWRKNQLSIALVPTMGNLHAGHLTLMEKAKQLADRVVASIFVNPLQFGPKEDFAAYPRTEDEDIAQLNDVSIDAVFLPQVDELYSKTSSTRVTPDASIANILCGKSRPGHFEGVATILAKLFNLIQPQFALFGEKDYQQFTLIRQMVQDLNFPISLISVSTIRETDGLAMSSRNQYLTPEERTIAPHLYKVLTELKTQILTGNKNYAKLTVHAQQCLEGHGFKVDYISVREQNTLASATADSRQLVILAAAFLDKTRLIDNILITI